MARNRSGYPRAADIIERGYDLSVRNLDRKDYGETRYIMLCPLGDLLFQVAYTWRGPNILIIFVGRGNQRERRLYEQRRHN